MSMSSTELPATILFCRLCQSLYRQPRTLPCLHSFCDDCLRQLAPSQTKEGQPSLACPVCGEMAPLTSSGVSGFTSNDFLARMCREYVGEVQRTLVSKGPMSPGASTSGASPRGPASPTSVLAGRTPPGMTVSSPGHSAVSSTSSQGGSTHLHGSMSPRQHTAFDYSFHSRPSSAVTTSFTSQSSRTEPSTTQAHEHLLHASLSPQRHSSSTSSSSSSDVVQQTARRLSAETISFRGVGIQRRLSSVPQDVLRTWECLQHKVNSLQAAALQLTYSLDTVSMTEATWHQRKQDLRRDVQRRSAQLQFFIKRQERLLLAALDSRQTDEGFQASADRARGELRDNLKSVMHETDVLRSVLDFATDTELMSLSSLLLGSPVAQTPVTMTTPELRLVVPEDVSLEDMVGKDFGCLTSTLVTQTVFTPEDVDFTSLGDDLQEEDDAFTHEPQSTIESTTISSTTTTTKNTDNFEDNIEGVSYIDEDSEDDEEEEDEEEEEVMVEETFELVDGKMQIVSKKSVPVSKKTEKPKKTRVRQTRANPAKEAKESTDTRGRGRERHSFAKTTSTTERTHLQKTTAESPGKAGAAHGASTGVETSKSEKTDTQSTADKFQSIRETLRQRRRELLLSSSGLSGPLPRRAVTDVIGQERRVQSLDRTSALRDQSRRSHSPASPQRRLVPSVAAAVVHSPVTHLQHSSIETRRLSTNGTTAAADGTEADPVSPTSPVSPTDRTSRPVRRAISAASDKASKMEYLRETWRRRKELLIQNEAFVTALPVKAPEEVESSEDVSGLTTGGEDSETTTTTTSTSGGKPGKVKHSLRSRFSNLKQALKKNGKSEDSKTAEKPDDATEDSKGPGKITLAPDTQQAVEERVLQTVESILQKKMSSGSSCETPGSLPTSTSTGSAPKPAPYIKPAMMVKPHPRDPSPGPPPSQLIGSTLEPLVEQEGKVTHLRQSGLRVTSPAGTDISKERIQQVRANIRRKKERWRSLSLT